MQTILIAGAGKSSDYLIQYLLSHAPRCKWKVIVADGDATAIAEKINGHTSAEAAVADITDNATREALVQRADIVISLMPPHLHILLAKDCLRFKKNLITSSYASPEMKALDKQVKEAGLMFMCEMGLDPGIDHMSASKIIHSIHRVAGTITCFKSYCGGLVAPESDNNPWHYKLSWNPMNVVTAGSAGAVYLLNGKKTEVPYDKMFEHNKKIKTPGQGMMAYYPNRDSLPYIDTYEVPDVKTFMRATLRHPDYCKGWNAIIALGLTTKHDTAARQGTTLAAWVKQKSAYSGTAPLPQFIALKLGLREDDKVISMLQWLGLFDETPVKPGYGSSADVLLGLLEDKWKMVPGDKDMVVMVHEVEYLHRDSKVKLCSSFSLTGEGGTHSAMAKSVGLPIAILAKLVLTRKIVPPSGVCIPCMSAVYRPILTELAHYGIAFKEEIE